MMKCSSIFEKTAEKISKALEVARGFGKKIDIIFRLDIESDSAMFRIFNGELENVNKNAISDSDQKKLYRLMVSSHLWRKFLDGNITFDDISFGGLLGIEQGELGYSTTFIRILRSLHSKNLLLSLDMFEPENDRENDYFECMLGDEILEIQSYCPHQGYRLCSENIRNGILICPGHNWSFQLPSGKCVRGDKNASLAVKRKAR